jgi:PPK2 family polyphosphate:nucleotide phosphotransferase
MDPKPLFRLVDSPYLAGEDFRVAGASTRPPRSASDKEALKTQLAASVDALDQLQRRLYADGRHAVLLIFQAMDAAGKDSTIRAVLSGVDPAGCQVTAFKRPSALELDHDFLWRTSQALPQRGRIGVFNRSYYEEVLAVRVHPEYAEAQRLPHGNPALRRFWAARYESIRDHERHLAHNGIVILKFWLHVSQDEQRQRLLARLDEPDKRWKFEGADLDVRARWRDYMRAYQAALRETSRPWAPWYAIPADSKPYMRATVADLIVRSLSSMDLRYPPLAPEMRSRIGEFRRRLSVRPRR